MRLDPNFVDAYYHRGNALYELGDEQKAFEDYRQAINIDPDGPDNRDEHGWYGRGLAHARLGNREKAIYNLQEAAKICAYLRDMSLYQRVQEAIDRLQSQS